MLRGTRAFSSRRHLEEEGERNEMSDRGYRAKGASRPVFLPRESIVADSRQLRCNRMESNRIETQSRWNTRTSSRIASTVGSGRNGSTAANETRKPKPDRGRVAADGVLLPPSPPNRQRRSHRISRGARGIDREGDDVRERKRDTDVRIHGSCSRGSTFRIESSGGSDTELRSPDPPRQKQTLGGSPFVPIKRHRIARAAAFFFFPKKKERLRVGWTSQKPPERGREKHKNYGLVSNIG